MTAIGDDKIKYFSLIYFTQRYKSNYVNWVIGVTKA